MIISKEIRKSVKYEGASGDCVHLNSIGFFYTIFGAIVLSGAIFPFLKLNPFFAFIHPHQLYQGSVLLIAVIGIYLLLPIWRVVAVRYVRAPFLLALMIWMALSLTWTVAPHTRISMSAALVTSTVYATYLAFATPRSSLLHVLAYSALLIMATSLIYTYTFTTRSFSFPGYQMMAGFYSNKNILVRVASMASVLAAFLLVWPIINQQKRDNLLHKAAWILLLIISVWMIARYHTFTAKIAVPAAGAAVLLVMIGARSRRWFMITLAIFVLASVGFLIFLDEILYLARETSGLHNRFYHWGQIINQDTVSPWTGAGLGGFWDRLTGPWKELELLSPLRHGHNGFIDTWLDLGFVGLLLVFANFAILVFRAFSVPFTRWHPLGYFMAAQFVVFFIYNLTESSILPTNSANTFLWAIFVTLILNPLAQKGKSETMIKDNS